MKNNPITFFLVGILGGFAAIAAPGAWAVDGGNFSVAAGFDYSTGKYGAASSTSILSIPVVGMYSSGLWAFKLTVPYVRISGPGGVSPNGIRTMAVSTTKNTTESGLGDLVAAATYNIYPGNEKEPWVYLTGKIKFGTADTALGTGRNDYAAQIDVYQNFGRFTAKGALGYEILGSPAGVSMNNVAYGIFGGYYQITDQTVGGAEVRLSQKPSMIGAEQRELTVYASHGIDKGLKIRGYVLKGFADGSPDSGFGLLLISDL
jgi:hypothetical protein